MMFEDLPQESIKERLTDPSALIRRINQMQSELDLLRNQVAELLPWARLGAHTAADDHGDIARFVVLGTRRIPLRSARAQDLLIRIDGNEFGGVS